MPPIATSKTTPSSTTVRPPRPPVTTTAPTATTATTTTAATTTTMAPPASARYDDLLERAPRLGGATTTTTTTATPPRGAGSPKTMSLLQLRMQPPSLPVDRSGDLKRLSAVQQTVLANARQHAATTSAEDRIHAVGKMKNLGFTEAQLDIVLDYVRTRSELTINIDPDKSLKIEAKDTSTNAAGDEFSVKVDRSLTVIDALCIDPMYRNQYETGISSGWGVSSASIGCDKWENRLFGGDYHQGPMVAHDRPKYGAMNIGLTAAGPASTYGSCYLIAKPGLRERTTFTATDSSQARSRDDVGTAQAFEHIIARMPDQMLKNLMASATDGTRSLAACNSYVEAQIHGPIEFSKDIAAVVIAEKFFDTPYHGKLLNFAKLYGLDVRWHLPDNTVVDDSTFTASRSAVSNND